MSNPYYDPEDFGLTIVGTVEWEEPCYSFDTTVIWYSTKTGQFYWASDSGCSCPSPFERYTSLEHLETGSEFEVLAFLQDALDERKKAARQWGEGDPYCAGDIFEVMKEIRMGDYMYRIQEETL
jgi:hypothetical protein